MPTEFSESSNSCAYLNAPCRNLVGHYPVGQSKGIHQPCWKPLHEGQPGLTTHNARLKVMTRNGKTSLLQQDVDVFEAEAIEMSRVVVKISLTAQAVHQAGLNGQAQNQLSPRNQDSSAFAKQMDGRIHMLERVRTKNGLIALGGDRQVAIQIRRLDI